MNLLTPKEENSFKKDLKKIKKRNKDINKLKQIVAKLIHQERLPEKNRNHLLKGNYKDLYECHIEPDWLLIYRTTKDSLILIRTGSHSDLFG
jgi:mRNA interferase YafQ